MKIPEEDALTLLAHAAGPDLCAVHEIGPVANHLVGPVAARRPSYHDNPTPTLGSSQYTVDRLIVDASGRAEITCTCVHPPSDRLYVIPGVSEGAIARPPRNDAETQAQVDAAMNSDDLDMALPILEPRLAALSSLVDRARQANGGDLTPELREAVEVIARTLAGSTRWSVIPGYEEGYSFPPTWRHGAPGIRASQYMTDPDVGRRIIAHVLGPVPDEITQPEPIQQPRRDSPPTPTDVPAAVLGLVHEGAPYGYPTPGVRHVRIPRRQRA